MNHTSADSLTIQDTERLNEKITLDHGTLSAAATILRAINNKDRQCLIDLLEEHKRLNVSEIYQRLDWDQSVTSTQLAILRTEKIVIAERKGQTIYYSLNYGRMASIAKKIADFLQTTN
jgi:DNA-binding transcriptional ArsR family regulator